MSERPAPPSGGMVSEYGFVCDLCQYRESWTTELACHVALIQHIRDNHPEVSRAMAADAGVDPAGIDMPPETYGRKLSGWQPHI